MIRPVCREIRLTGLAMTQYVDSEHLESYIQSSIARSLSQFLINEEMLYIDKEYRAYEDEYVYRGTLYVATEDDYNNFRGYRPEPPKPTSGELTQMEHAGYERGVRVAMAHVANRVDELQKDKLKKNHHAAAVLIETAVEIEEDLLDG